MIADDNAATRDILETYIEMHIEQDPSFRIVGVAKDGEQLLELIILKKPDLALVDISMPKLTGMEVIMKSIKVHPFLHAVFITGHDDYAIKAFEVEAVDYIVKPFERIRLVQALEKAKKMIRSARKDKVIDKSELLKKLITRSDKTTHFVKYEELLFIERVRRKSYLHTKDKVIESNENLQELLERLPENFYQTHRSYVVNIDCITEMIRTGETYIGHLCDTDKTVHIVKNRAQYIQKLKNDSDKNI